MVLSDLIVEFDAIDSPTIFPEEEGTVQVVVTNQGDAQVNGPVTLKLFASTDSDLDLPLNTLNSRLEGTDELLGSVTRRAFNLQPGQSTTLTLDFASPAFRTPSVVSPGAYNLIAQIDSSNAVTESDETNNLASAFVSTDGTDAVLDWNATLLNAIQAVASRPETTPPVAARNQAIVHAAIYDAVNAIDQSHSSYLVNIDPSEAEGASAEAAAVGAAYQTLINLYPTEAAAFEAQRIRSLAEIPDGAAEDAGFDLGVSVADQILALRSNDGSAGADDVPYTPGTDPGDWRPTPPNLSAQALLPGWGDVTPFAISSVEDIIQDSGVNGPPEYGSAEYQTEINEVQALGSRNSSTRTADQTEIARFWAYDRPDTFRPPGQWNEIAQQVALQQGNTLAENARLFALLNIAEADAGIVAWDLKYTYNQLRPIAAIRQTTDPNWTPLLDTPPFPDYVSGHATFGAAAGQILASFFGDDVSFSIPSQELPGVSRSYNSFSEAVDENAISRVYAGVHVRSSCEDGALVGEAVANSVFNNILV